LPLQRMEVQGVSRKTTRSGFGVSAPIHAEVVSLAPKVDIERTSKQISWVLRRGARQAGVRIDSEGWVLISELTQCMYFSDFTEKELTNLMIQSNRSKQRYEIWKSQHGDMVRATWRDDRALHPPKADDGALHPRTSVKADGGQLHPCSSLKVEPSSASPGIIATSRSPANSGSTAPSIQASAKYESPLVDKASPSSFRFRSTAQEFRPMMAHCTPVARPARPPGLEFTPTPLRQNLFAGTFTPGHHVAVPSAYPSSWSEKSNLLAIFNEERSRMAERRATAAFGTACPGERVTCSRYQRPPEKYLTPSAASTPSRPQHGSRVQTAAKTVL
jgi:hypothetical protein